MIDLRGTRWQEVYSKDDLASEIHRLAAVVTELERLLREATAYLPIKVIVYTPDGCFERLNGEAVLHLRGHIDSALGGK